ncbi:MAG: zinc ribbon domain-containing protein [Gammaproteobacteria bacterium]|nr:zinc ribbon domain-containing protein [Gammaproteobacteria bacterium]
MYSTCPKCGHRPAGADLARASACPACGVVFSKWLKQRLRPEAPIETDEPALEALDGVLRSLAAPLFHVGANVNPFLFAGRCVTLIALAVWSVWFFQTDHRELYGHLPEINESFMHTVNLAFHEAGHVLFRLLGEFMAVLGGSLMQLLVPAAVLVAFVYRHDNAFGGAVALWWLGQSAMDLAPYIYDAKHGQLLLIGGFIGAERPGAHDWSNILGRLGMLDYSHALGTLMNVFGMVVMVLALVWGAWLLRSQYANLDRRF